MNNLQTDKEKLESYTKKTLHKFQDKYMVAISHCKAQIAEKNEKIDYLEVRVSGRVFCKRFSGVPVCVVRPRLRFRPTSSTTSRCVCACFLQTLFGGSVAFPSGYNSGFGHGYGLRLRWRLIITGPVRLARRRRRTAGPPGNRARSHACDKQDRRKSAEA